MSYVYGPIIILKVGDQWVPLVPNLEPNRYVHDHITQKSCVEIHSFSYSCWVRVIVDVTLRLRLKFGALAKFLNRKYLTGRGRNARGRNTRGRNTRLGTYGAH